MMSSERQIADDQMIYRVLDLQRALLWYADTDNYRWGPGDSESESHRDHGRRARIALGNATADDIETAKYDAPPEVE
jgi:hypothetical protein